MPQRRRLHYRNRYNNNQSYTKRLKVGSYEGEGWGGAGGRSVRQGLNGKWKTVVVACDLSTYGNDEWYTIRGKCHRFYVL